VFLTDASLTRLMNEKIGKDGKVHDLKFSADHNQLKITGKAKKVIDVPFTLEGPVKPTSTGQIELDAKSVKGGWDQGGQRCSLPAEHDHLRSR
jgi:hypothetical protein